MGAALAASRRSLVQGELERQRGDLNVFMVSVVVSIQGVYITTLRRTVAGESR
jgi:hypothetical protein